MRIGTQRIIGSNNSTIVVGKVFGFLKGIPTHIGRGLFTSRPKPIVRKSANR